MDVAAMAWPLPCRLEDSVLQHQRVLAHGGEAHHIHHLAQLQGVFWTVGMKSPWEPS
jgi:hypothetical protein